MKLINKAENRWKKLWCRLLRNRKARLEKSRVRRVSFFLKYKIFKKKRMVLRFKRRKLFVTALRIPANQFQWTFESSHKRKYSCKKKVIINLCKLVLL